MKPTTLFLIALFTTFATAATNPCSELRAKKKVAHLELSSCLKAWGYFRPEEADPKDDCLAKTHSFVLSVKNLKSCVIESVRSESSVE